MNPPTLVSLDPSSTAIGWAWFDDGWLRDAGVIRAPTKPVKLAKDSAWRVCSMIRDMRDEKRIPWFTTPLAVVVERPQRYVRPGMNAAGVIVTAEAFGAVCERVHATIGMRPDWAYVDDWSGKVPKATRAGLIHLEYGGRLDFSDDRGHDMADAIGLGQWWLAQQRIMEATTV